MKRHTYSFEIECPMPAEWVIDAFTDFSPKRPLYFPNLSRATFEVIEHGKTSALVQEGTGPFVTKERYDWSTRGRIWSQVVESNTLAPGSLTDIRVEERGPARCHMRFNLEREFIGRRGAILHTFIVLNGRRRFFRRGYLRALKNVRRARRNT